MGFLFKQRKNKRFSYKPRFYEIQDSWYEQETRTRYEEFQNKLDQNRVRHGSASERLRQRQREDMKRMSRVFLLVVLLMVFGYVFFKIL